MSGEFKAVPFELKPNFQMQCLQLLGYNKLGYIWTG